MARSTRSNPGPVPKTLVSLRLDPDLLRYVDDLRKQDNPPKEDKRVKRSEVIRRIIIAYRALTTSTLGQILKPYKDIMPLLNKKKPKR